MSKLTYLLILLLFCINTAFATAEHKSLWERWEAYEPLSHKTIDHHIWQDFLTRHVKEQKNGLSYIDYPKISNAEALQLNNYIWQMSQVIIDEYNRREQLAYWINLYNALVVKTVLDHFPTPSINDINISPGLFREGPWNAKLIKVEETPLSLNDIENRILRPIWNDPRIHYALNYAAISSPNIQKTAFTASNLDVLLNKGAREYINSLRAVQVIAGKLVTSSLFTWFMSDYGMDEEDVIAHISYYAKPKLHDSLRGKHHIDKTVFNWHLNNYYGRATV